MSLILHVTDRRFPLSVIRDTDAYVLYGGLELYTTQQAIVSFVKDINWQNPEQLGRAIRLKRQEKGLSQSALAAQLGVGRKWVIHIESGNPFKSLSRQNFSLNSASYACSPAATIGYSGNCAVAVP